MVPTWLILIADLRILYRSGKVFMRSNYFGEFLLLAFTFTALLCMAWATPYLKKKFDAGS